MANNKRTTSKKSSSSLEKSIKKGAKKVYKKNKNKPVFWIVLLILIIIIAGAAIFFVKMNPNLIKDLTDTKNTTSEISGTKESNIVPSDSKNTTPEISGTKESNINPSDTKNTTTHVHHDEKMEGVVYDDFQIHFLEFSSDSAGDSVYIKAGDTDILIDAGNKNDNSEKLKSQIDNYCHDNKLEYVIITHGDSDHITSFYGSSKKNGLLYTYDVGTIIYNQNTNKSNKTTSLYSNLMRAVDYCVSKGTTRKYAHEYFEEDKLTAKSDSYIKLSDNVEMDILYNPYYFTKTDDENNYSVCTLFKYTSGTETHNFLLTGDLEKEGEEALVKHYQKGTYGTLPHVDLYKGGHHGSKTSSNTILLDTITPDICCVCSCAGTNEYTTDYTNQFPTQQFINRIAKYTEKVYITGLYENGSFKPMNGRITISCGFDSNTNKVEVGIAATNNLIKLKDSDWFNETIYVKNYKEATSKDLDNINSCPHGNNSDKAGSNIFYTKDDPNVKAVPRRIWPSYGV